MKARPGVIDGAAAAVVQGRSKVWDTSLPFMNPTLHFDETRQPVLPLLGERAGVRADFRLHLSDFRAALAVVARFAKRLDNSSIVN
jgi:hypothetical protein